MIIVPYDLSGLYPITFMGSKQSKIEGKVWQVLCNSTLSKVRTGLPPPRLFLYRDTGGSYVYSPTLPYTPSVATLAMVWA